MLLLLAAWLAAPAMAQDSSPDLLSRVADQAAILAEKAPSVLAEETLEQRTLQGSGPRMRVGKTAAPLPVLRLGRTIVSEYTVAPLKDSESKDLFEFRQVISVDGRPVQSTEKARHALSLGIQSASEGVRKRMLENFAKYGLVDVATDYALILLAFTSRGQEQLTILPSDDEHIGADAASVFAWAQSAPGGGELIFAGRQAARMSAGWQTLGPQVRRRSAAHLGLGRPVGFRPFHPRRGHHRLRHVAARLRRACYGASSSRGRRRIAD